jgi:hypothetical protein
MRNHGARLPPPRSSTISSYTMSIITPFNNSPVPTRYYHCIDAGRSNALEHNADHVPVIANNLQLPVGYFLVSDVGANYFSSRPTVATKYPRARNLWLLRILRSTVRAIHFKFFPLKCCTPPRLSSTEPPPLRPSTDAYNPFRLASSSTPIETGTRANSFSATVSV